MRPGKKSSLESREIWISSAIVRTDDDIGGRPEKVIYSVNGEKNEYYLSEFATLFSTIVVVALINKWQTKMHSHTENVMTKTQVVTHKNSWCSMRKCRPMLLPNYLFLRLQYFDPFSYSFISDFYTLPSSKLWKYAFFRLFPTFSLYQSRPISYLTFLESDSPNLCQSQSAWDILDGP